MIKFIKEFINVCYITVPQPKRIRIPDRIKDPNLILNRWHKSVEANFLLFPAMIVMFILAILLEVTNTHGH